WHHAFDAGRVRHLGEPDILLEGILPALRHLGSGAVARAIGSEDGKLEPVAAEHGGIALDIHAVALTPLSSRVARPEDGAAGHPLRRSPRPCRHAWPDGALPCCATLRQGRWRGALGAPTGAAPQGRVIIISQAPHARSSKDVVGDTQPERPRRSQRCYYTAGCICMQTTVS